MESQAQTRKDGQMVFQKTDNKETWHIALIQETKGIRLVTKAIRNAGKVLNMKILTINMHQNKIKVKHIKIPHSV